MGASPELSVIVPCFEQATQLNTCLAALSSQDLVSDYEVIVVDSGPDDRVAAVVADWPGVRLVRSDTKLLPGAARNLGVSKAASEIVVFTDADCVPDRGFLRAARDRLRRGARLATGPVTDAPGGFIAACDNLLQFADFSAGRPTGPATYAPGCNLAMRKLDFLAAGGFPDGLAEDTRLSNAVLARWPKGMVFDNAMRVAHAGRATLGALLEHHRGFGVSRALHGLNIRSWQMHLGRYRVMLPAVAAKRLSYIVSRVLRYCPRRWAFLLCSTPILLLGLLAWAQGFRAGLLLDSQRRC